MNRLFLFGTLRWGDLLAAVAGGPVAVTPARLPGWRVERAAAGDWPVLMPDPDGGAAEGVVTEPLSDEARARLDWYEVTFGYGFEATQVLTDVGPVMADVYREGAEGQGGSGAPWDLDAWRSAHGDRTLVASAEVLRGRGQVPPETIAARRGVIQARAQGIILARSHDRTTTVGGELTAADVEVSEVRHPYDGFHRVEEWMLDHARFDGSRSGPIARAISHVTDAATLLPYDPATDRVLVVEQIRIGALAKGDRRPWMLEPVAGLIDAGETPESSAIREAREEAGLTLTPADLRFVARYYPSPGGLAQVLHSYVGLCDLSGRDGGLHGLATESEDLRAHVLPLGDLMAMVASGEAANAPLILSAQWLALNRDGLRLNA